MPIKRTLLVDGGAKSRLWRTILTDVTRLEMIYIAQNPGAPLGDALLAGLGSEVIEDPKVINEWLEITDTTKPDTQNTSTYNQYYNLFKKNFLCYGHGLDTIGAESRGVSETLRVPAFRAAHFLTARRMLNDAHMRWLSSFKSKA